MLCASLNPNRRQNWETQKAASARHDVDGKRESKQVRKLGTKTSSASRARMASMRIDLLCDGPPYLCIFHVLCHTALSLNRPIASHRSRFSMCSVHQNYFPKSCLARPVHLHNYVLASFWLERKFRYLLLWLECVVKTSRLEAIACRTCLMLHVVPTMCLENSCCIDAV